MNHMFCDCRTLEDASTISNWDVSGVEIMDAMFEDCAALNETPSWYNVEKIEDEEAIEDETEPQEEDSSD